MASLSAALCRNLKNVPRRAFTTTSVTHGAYPKLDPKIGKRASDDVKVPSPIGHSTGAERYELLANVKGIKDPFGLGKEVINNKSTEAAPNLVTSVEPERVIGCLCEPDAFVYCWWTLYAGEPQRCMCGHWFKLVPHAGYDIAM